MNVIDCLILLGFFIFYFVLPGFILNLLYRKEVEFHEALGLSIPLSFFFHLPITFIGYCFKIKLIYLLLVFAILIICIILQLLRIKSKIIFEFKPTILLASFGVIYGAISLCSGWYPQGDAAIHIQAVRNMIYDGFLSQPYYSLINKEIVSDHSYDIYYVLLAIITKFSKIELTFIWHYLGPLFSFMLPFSIFYFGIVLTKNLKLSYTLIVSFLIVSLFFSETMFGGYFDVAQYPNRIYLWFSLIHIYNFMFDYYEFPSKKNLFVILAFLVPLIFIHQEGYVIFFVVTFIICLIHTFKYGLRKSENLWVLIVILATITLPILFVKMSGSLKFIALTNNDIWKKHYHIVDFTEHLFAFPLSNYSSLNHQIFFILTIAVLFYSYKQNINYRIKYLILASFLVPVIFVLNPFVVPILSKYGSFVLVNRLQRAPLIFLSLGLFLYFISFKSRYFQNLALMAFIAVVAYSTYRLYLLNGIGHKDLRILDTLHLIPENSNIIADPQTSIDIAMYKKTNHSTFKFNGAVDLVDLRKEKMVFNTLLSDSFALDTIFYIKDKKIDFIITNNLVYKELSPIKDKKVFGNGFFEIYKL